MNKRYDWKWIAILVVCSTAIAFAVHSNVKANAPIWPWIIAMSLVPLLDRNRARAHGGGEG